MSFVRSRDTEPPTIPGFEVEMHMQTLATKSATVTCHYKLCRKYNFPTTSYNHIGSAYKSCSLYDSSGSITTYNFLVAQYFE